MEENKKAAQKKKIRGKQTGILGKKEATQIEVMRYATQFDDKTKEGVSV